MKLYGTSTEMSEKHKVLRGPECSLDDFSIDRIIIEEGN